MRILRTKRERRLMLAAKEALYCLEWLNANLDGSLTAETETIKQLAKALKPYRDMS